MDRDDIDRIVKLSKEDVARRQLDQAIKLMFEGGDVVSVHTLASAASQVFADLLKHAVIRLGVKQSWPNFPVEKRRL